MEFLLISLLVVLSLFLRWVISTFPYSGMNTGPMFGDYEAQRHWQEITINLPASQWYKNSSDNDLLYWGLDYPPLTAYHSWLVGSVGFMLNQSWVELHGSRGVESYHHKLFMRYSVLVSDLLVYIPSCLLYSNSFSHKVSWHTLLSLLLYPGLVIIDHGHFQYNSVSLGFFILAVAFLDRNRILLGSIAFCLALNYKQMELYHAFPFFVYILGYYFNQKTSYAKRLLGVACVGIAVIGTFLVCWAPFSHSPDDVLAVIHRLFPFSRGLFEDKVSNFWCSSNVVFKIKTIFTQSTIVSLCLFTTLLSILPSSVKLLTHPSMINFKYALVISSLGFFLFSYQVHEKTILVPVVSSLLIVDQEPFMVALFSITSIFSMLPLLIKDGLLLAYVATTTALAFVLFALYGSNLNNLTKKLLTAATGLGVTILTICAVAVRPPERFPDLWPVLVSLFSCAHFILYYLYFNYQMIIGHSQHKLKSQ
ncbi:ALG6 [Bugula neritina]|uniref:Alpha-1,3-glucosyltransferase n=1 Tax=Bugula neritina TaxID=10212 RepID=A0A7J7K2K2_BUGNE|nr:ALG6 [Bugula neritina]